MDEEPYEVDEDFKPLAVSYLYDWSIHLFNETRKELDKRSDWAFAITGGMITALILSDSTAPGKVQWQTKVLLLFLLVSSASGLIARFLKLKADPSGEEFPGGENLINLIKSGDSLKSEIDPGFPKRWAELLQIQKEILGLKRFTEQESLLPGVHQWS